MQVEGYWTADETAADASVETDEDAASFAGWVDRDRAMNDDFLNFTVDTTKVDHTNFFDAILPVPSTCMAAFRIHAS